MSKNVRITTELKSPSDLGIYYRLLCMTGPNKGKVYYLTGKRVVIGRGDNTDIQIVDTKISREHAELAFADKSYVITDLGAQNGVIVNDSKVKQKKLEDNEKIVIGQTVFKYNIIEVTQSLDMVIVNEAEAKGVSKETAKELLKEIKKGPVKAKTKDLNEEPMPTRKPDKKNNSRMLIFGIVVAAVLFVLMDNEEPQKKSNNSRGNSSMDDFNEMMAEPKRQDDPDVKKKLEALIHSGRREFREGNYFRAMEEFRLAKLLSPGNRDATYYENKAKQKLDEEIRSNFDKGNQEFDSKKYQASIVSYCAVIQLIKEYPDDQRYKNAMLKISAVESELGMEKGEIKCFEEKSTDSRN